MKIRPKTIRRLLLVAAFAGASSAVVGAAFIYRRQARDAQLSADRSAGMAAFDSGDLAHVITPLTAYVAARPDDVDAIFALASADYAVETPGRDNLFEARSRLQQVLARQPNHLLAKRELLKIYERTRLSRELLATADDVLRAVPGDPDATRSRAVALTALDRDADALPAWEAYLALMPTDFQAQTQLLAAMKRTGKPPEELVAHAQADVEKSPDDPRFLLPLAAALREAGRDAEAQTLLENIAAKPQSDPKFVVELAAALDRSRSFDVAEQLLARSAASLDSTTLTTALIERMWQNGRHEQVIDATAKLLASAVRRDPNLLALRALSLAATGKRTDAQSVVAEIDGITSSDEAKAWSGALAIEFASAASAPSDQARALRQALGHDPDNGILYVWLGRALRSAGESEQAARCFREAAQRLPSWATPCIELADLMLEAGRTADAASAAKAAFFRAPSNLAVQLQVARVRFAELNSKASPEEIAELLARVEALTRLIPADPALPAMRASLLSLQGKRDAAEAVVRDATANLPRGIDLEPLYAAALRNGLSSSAIVFDRATAEGTLTPSFAVSHAADLADKSGDASSAIAWMHSQASDRPSDPEWALADARVSHSLDDASAADAWRRLIANFPDNLRIQLAALDEAAPFIGDRAAQAPVIERLKILSGEDSTAYRIARARWLASSTDDGQARQALSIAADLVRQQPGRTDLRILLARVLVRLDSAGTALEHLRAAHDQSPADCAIALEYADTLRRTGKWAEATALLKAQSSYDVPDTSSRGALASALIQAADFDDAASMLQRATARGPLSLDEQLLAATALDGKGDITAATTAFASLAADGRATPAMLASAAAFERRLGHADRAAAIITQIEQCRASADDRAQAIAQYAIQFGDVDVARGRYNAELAKGSAGIDLTIAAIGFEASQGNLPAATLEAKRALERFPNEPRIKVASLEVAAQKAIADGDKSNAALDALVDAMAADPDSRRKVEALRALRQSNADDSSTPELAERLAVLADANPTSIELADQAIAASLSSNQPQIASGIARRLLASNAIRVDAIALGAKTLLQLNDLPSARRAAERWRLMAASAPEPADLLLAQIALAEDAPDRALAKLEPYRSTIAWDRDPAMPTVLVTALARVGRGDEAFDLLIPALPSSSAARTAWLGVTSIACNANGDAAVAQLVRLESATPPDMTTEQVRLAGAYLDVAQTFPLPQAAEHGIALLTPLEGSGRLTGNARALLGELQRVAGAKSTAIATLREALRVEPDNAMVKNSLAYALLGTPGTEDESCRLASEAVAAGPLRAEFRDTLARAYLATHQSAKAEASFREAIRLDQDSLDAWIGLATLQTQIGKPSDAQASMRRVDGLLAKCATRDAPLYLRDELRSVRDSVASTGQ